MLKRLFDFSYTCPKIDKAISEAENTIQSYLKDYIIELCPYVSNGKAIELSKNWGSTIYNDISNCFESVRETNEDMRKAAEDQISNLNDTIDDLNNTIKDFEDQIDYLNDQLKSLD
jgi:flagellar hook-associated protein FlgK